MVRNGRVVAIAADDLQIGDHVLIQAGDIVPADLKLLDAADLEVDEFELTGEIMPVSKRLQPNADIRVFQGSRVLRGHGKGLVIAAGEETEYGKMVKASGRYDKDDRPHRIKKGHLALLLLFLPALLVRFKFYHDHSLIFITYPLLVFFLLLLQNRQWGQRLIRRRLQQRLRRRNILLRDAGVLDDLRRINLFCFDKTGVLTSRLIKVKEIYLGGGNLSIDGVKDHKTWDILLTGSALCNDLEYHQEMALANSLDRAFMSFAEDHGIRLDQLRRQYRRIYQKPFTSEERYMACGFDSGPMGRRIFFAKGDPEVIGKRCNRYVAPGDEIKSLDISFWSALRTQIEEMSRDGSIVMALAFSENSFPSPPVSYTFLGLFRLENPLHPEAKRLWQDLRKRGIRNVILTGDRTETTWSIGAELGIEHAATLYLTGRQIDRMSLSEVARQCDYVSIFTRLSPSQKGIIARIFQQRGHTVAVVGDGTNDVIALKSADVGISFVERSSPLAKRAAKVLINDLSDIPLLLEAGRRAQRQFRFTVVCLALLFLLLILGDYLYLA